MSSSSSSDDHDDDGTIKLPLADSQEILLTLLSIVTGALSIMGSLTIVYRILAKRFLVLAFSVNNTLPSEQQQQHQQQQNQRMISSRRRRRRNQNTNGTSPYDHIMLGLSCFDIVASTTFAIAPFMLPQQSARAWAFGSDSTCSALGVLYQLSFAAVTYNTLLSLYYLLTVRFGLSRQWLRRRPRLEQSTHLSIVVFYIGTAFWGLGQGMYSENDLGMSCWVNDDSLEWAGWLFGGISVLLAFVTLPVINLVIYCHVRRQLNPSLPSSSTTTRAKTTLLGISSTTSVLAGSSRNSNHPTDHANPTQQHRYYYDDDHDDGDDDDDEAEKNDFQQVKQAAALATTHTEAVRADLRRRQIREVAIQGILYVGSFLLCYGPLFVLRVGESQGWERRDERRLFPLLVCYHFFVPLQGCFNMFIYHRPNYVRVRRAFPDMSSLAVIRMVCFHDDIPRLDGDAVQRDDGDDGGPAHTGGKDGEAGEENDGDAPPINAAADNDGAGTVDPTKKQEATNKNDDIKPKQRNPRQNYSHP